MADPGFFSDVGGSRQPPILEQKQLFDKVFAQKGYMKMTEIGQREEHPKRSPWIRH